MKKRIYLASSWRNARQPTILTALRFAGHEVYDFHNPQPGDNGFSWSEIDPNWQRWTAAQQIDAYSHPAAKRGLHLDFEAMKWADTCVMLQPCGRSASLELGWFVGAGKPTAVLMDEGCEPELMIRLADYLTSHLEDLLVWLERPLLTKSSIIESYTVEETAGNSRVISIRLTPEAKQALDISEGDSKWRT